MEVKYIDYGIGNRVGDKIYLHKKLKNNPKLHDAVLRHEREHNSDPNISDLKLDLRNEHLDGIRGTFYWFVLSHPSTWVNFSPIMKLNGKWCIDINLSLFWLSVLFIGLFIYGVLI